MSPRSVCLWIHRWTGLVMALFLIIAGLTGSILVFKNELDAWLNPELFRIASSDQRLALSELVQRAEQAEPRIRVASVPLKVLPGETAQLTVQARIDEATGKRYELDFDQLFVDPATGVIVGRREADEALIPMIYSLHYTLLMPGGWGKLMLGIVAIVWVINCFIGFYLTLPRGRPFMMRWKPAWLIKRNASFYRLNLDLHRAGALWLWGVLLCLAVSSVYLNLNFEVFRPTVSLFSTLSPNPFDPAVYRPRLRMLAETPDRVRMSFEQAIVAVELEGRRRGWAETPSRLTHIASLGIYMAPFRASQHDWGTGLGTPLLYIDDSDGSVLRAVVPNEGSAGDRFLQLQLPLHSGRIAGWPGRIVICLAGIVVAVLSITGIAVWWMKRRVSIRTR